MKAQITYSADFKYEEFYLDKIADHVLIEGENIVADITVPFNLSSSTAVVSYHLGLYKWLGLENITFFSKDGAPISTINFAAGDVPSYGSVTYNQIGPNATVPFSEIGIWSWGGTTNTSPFNQWVEPWIDPTRGSLMAVNHHGWYNFSLNLFDIIGQGPGGRDYLEGGEGNDNLVGGGGSDYFIFDALENGGTDAIWDYRTGDVIAIHNLSQADLEFMSDAYGSTLKITSKDGQYSTTIKFKGVQNVTRIEDLRIAEFYADLSSMAEASSHRGDASPVLVSMSMSPSESIDSHSGDYYRLPEGVYFDEVELRQSGQNLILVISETGEQITFVGQLSGDVRLQYIVDDSGSTFQLPKLETVIGTSGDDIFLGSENVDYFYGSEGNDQYDGYVYSDTLDYSLLSQAIFADLRVDVKKGDLGVDQVVRIENVIGTAFDDYILGTAEGNYLAGKGGDDYIAGDRNPFELPDEIVNTALDFTEGTPEGWTHSSASRIQGGRLNFLGSHGTDYAKYEAQLSDAEQLILTQPDNYIHISFNYGEYDLGWRSDYLEFVLYALDSAGNVIGSTHDKIYVRSNNQSYSTVLKDIVGAASYRFDVRGTSNDPGWNIELYNLNVKTVNTSEADGSVSDHDILEGGHGDDFLAGGAGDDVYIWSLGDGNDTIHEFSEGHDAIELGEGITREDISFLVDGRDLLIIIGENGETLRLINHFTESQQLSDTGIVETVRLANGGEISLLEINTVIDGSDDVDVIQAGAGNDIITAGMGDDFISGGSGQDIYIWTLGDGSDEISEFGNDLDHILFGEGVLYADLSFEKSGQDYLISHIPSGAVVTFKNHFNQLGDLSETGIIEILVFADGSEHSLTDMDLTITGSDESDNIRGSSGDDAISGGTGADYYRWGVGLGNDIIDELGTDQDQIILAGVSSIDDINIAKDALDLVLTITASGETLRLLNHYLPTGEISKVNVVEHLLFEDGSLVDLTKLTQTIVGTDGEDILSGGVGNDQLSGGLGSDTLSGGRGDDLYLWSKGDGHDVIHDLGISQDKADRLKLIDVDANDISISVSSNDPSSVEITIISTGEIITLVNVIGDKASFIEEIEFRDGSVELLDPILKDIYTQQGTDLNDVLAGSEAYDRIEAGAGDDIILASKGADDYLGGEGVDTVDYSSFSESVFTDLRKSDQETGSLHSYNSIENLIGSNFDDQLIGTDGDNIISGGGGNDTLIGGLGADTLTGGAGADIFEADWDELLGDVITDFDQEDTLLIHADHFNAELFSATFDTLTNQLIFDLDGDSIADGSIAFSNDLSGSIWAYQLTLGGDIEVTVKLPRHIFGTGDSDTISETGTDLDIVYIKEPLTVFDVEFSKDGVDLLITIIETLRLLNHFTETGMRTEEAKVELVRFADGSGVNLEELGLDITGTDGDDLLNGYIGDDVIDGGLGNDLLEGEEGFDVYKWGVNSGSDTIVETGGDIDAIELGEGIAEKDLSFHRLGLDLVITNIHSQETLTLKNHFKENGEIANEAIVELLVFNDESVKYLTDIDLNIVGSNLADTLFGSGGNDQIEAGLGADQVDGGAGEDLYIWSKGDGNDILNDFGA